MQHQRTATSRGVARLRAVLPYGRRLSDEMWAVRHRGLTALLWCHVPALWGFALVQGFPPLHATQEAGVLALLAALASCGRLGRALRSSVAAVGLVVASSILVHLWGGVIEAHFHFFVVLSFLALYQAWLPFLLALGYVVVEHGLMGALAPESVYNHPAAVQSPWTWALVHGSFVLAASVASLFAWRITENEALHDALTGLPNRVTLLERLDAAVREDPERTALIYLDLDDFKAANDGFGHDVGDELLQQVGHRLRAALRDDELLVRLGGDEFAVLLSRLRSPQDARAAADRVQEALKRPFDIGSLSISTSASAGLALIAAGDDARSLVRNADLAMLEAKRDGGGRWREYAPVLHAVALRRTELGAELRTALERGELEVHYQPIFALDTGAVVGTEALARWRHPTRGLVPPAEFIPVAEQSGLIVPLGRWVLREACAQTAAWQAQHPALRSLTVSVNLAPRQLAEADLLSTVVEALRDSALAPESLCLEITEGSLIRDLEASLLTLRSLRAVGLRLALDDFGTGYSSLSYLQRLPVDIVKIDRSFVAELGRRPQSREIVSAVVDLARALGLSVTAEGVETAEQQSVLRDIGCQNGQGWVRAPALPAKELVALLASGTQVPAPRGARLRSLPR